MDVLFEKVSFGGVQGKYQHRSSLCNGDMQFTVFVPPGSAGSTDEQRFPVVFFLSGLTCTPMNFTEKAGAQRVAAELGLIVVAPDTSPRRHEGEEALPGEDEHWDFGSSAGFYVDATEEPWNRTYAMYSYVTEELPELIDAQFPTRGPAYRSIMGHSMGGHGALVAGLREPAKWRSVSAFSPICAPAQVPWGQKAFAAYLGEDPAFWSQYDATALVAGSQHPSTILIDQGKADPFLTEQLRPELFAEACSKTDQVLELRMQDGHDHSYYFIATYMEDHLRHHHRYLGER